MGPIDESGREIPRPQTKLDPVALVEGAIAAYGRSNPDALWRRREAESVVSALRAAGALREGL